MTFKNGDRVKWKDQGKWYTGKVINEEKYPNGTNPWGFYCIAVDDLPSNRACLHTAREMHSGWVSRCVEFNSLTAAD